MNVKERKTMWVCPTCLKAIMSREGKIANIKHDLELELDEVNEENSVCDWCEESGFTTLHELI